MHPRSPLNMPSASIWPKSPLLWLQQLCVPFLASASTYVPLYCILSLGAFLPLESWEDEFYHFSLLHEPFQWLTLRKKHSKFFLPSLLLDSITLLFLEHHRNFLTWQSWLLHRHSFIPPIIHNAQYQTSFHFLLKSTLLESRDPFSVLHISRWCLILSHNT